MRTERFDQSRRWKVHDHGHAPVEFGGHSYGRFSRWLDHQLAKLVARWTHTAAPGAQRPGLRFRPRKPK